MSRSELATLVAQKDWSQTPLGPMETWPQSLRSVVNIMLTSRFAMWMGWGPELVFLYNDAYRPTLGIKHPWALGSSTSSVWAEIWLDISTRIETVLSNGEATWDEGLLLFLERSGFPEETYHTFSYSPLNDDSGKVNGILCVVTEETHRIINERRLATLRDLAAGLTAATSEHDLFRVVKRQMGANTADLPFSLTYLFTDSGEARLVCATGIAEGHPAAPSRIVDGGRDVWHARELWAHATPRLAEWRGTSPWPSGAWDKPPEQAAIIPIRQQASDRPAGFLVIGINPYRRYDIDYAGFVDLIAGQIAAAIASVRAYEEERRRAEALAELDRAKTTFFSNVSHEFRTPLTLMLGHVEDLLGNPGDNLTDENRERLEVVQRSGFRLQRLVNTLLDFSRIEAGRAQASRQPVDLAVLTSELASGFRSAMERGGLQFTVDCRPLSRPAFVDREMWEKIVLNLVSNAFKYTLQGSVSVRLRERGETAELSVTDTGVGIPESDIPHLFDRFYRVAGTRGRTHEGTGIGLALVQELIQLHGGTVTAQSDPGRGSTFTVLLPLHPGENAPELPLTLASTALHPDAYIEETTGWAGELDRTPYPVSASAPSRGVVLLADDNADMRNYVHRLLSTRYDVIAVANGQEALDAALQNPPDLVLTDVMMPVLDGFGLLSALRADARTKTLPILLLSARAGEESRVEGLDAGADDYLVKPFTARELMARVESHLSLARMRRETDQVRRLSEMRLGLALESSHMVAWEWDLLTDRILTAGDQRNMFGITFQTSAEWFRTVQFQDAAAHRGKVDEVRTHGGSWHSEFRIRRPDTGQVAWLDERAAAIADETGAVRRIVGVTVDITERKTAETELERKNEALVKANEELEEFAYVASHDLQEPLRMVNIYAELLLRQIGSEKDHDAWQYAEFVRKGVVQMEALIKDLLLYSRVVHPEQEAAHAADLNQSLEQALSVLRIKLEETRATLVREPLPVVLGDERQLSLVFQNLISNALKYRPAGVVPRIEIKAVSGEGEWIVMVTDNGIGFQPRHASRIFGLFKRLHKDSYPGTGLGLAISKRIVERYAGQIWAESAGEGFGATFSFRLRQARI